MINLLVWRPIRNSECLVASTAGFGGDESLIWGHRARFLGPIFLTCWVGGGLRPIFVPVTLLVVLVGLVFFAVLLLDLVDVLDLFMLIFEVF